jgi:hypothetical protein
MSTFIYDAETRALPWDTIKSLYVPPIALPPWDDSMCKMGNLKEPSKRTEKLAATRADYATTLAEEKANRELHRTKWASEAALSPVTGAVLAIGFRTDAKSVIVGADGETEPEILEAFWTVYRKHQRAGRFVGYCSNTFDFPFIVWRSYLHAIEVPASAWDKTGRYPAYCFVDLMDRLPKRGFSDESRKLTDICKWLGIGQKPEEIDGSDFARLWAGDAESRQQALAYLENDLDMIWKLAERMGVIQ